MISGAVAAAIRIERNAVTFYEESSYGARRVFGRQMFKGFICDRLTIEKNDRVSILNETCTFLRIPATGVYSKKEEREKNNYSAEFNRIGAPGFVL